MTRLQAAWVLLASGAAACAGSYLLFSGNGTTSIAAGSRRTAPDTVSRPAPSLSGSPRVAGPAPAEPTAHDSVDCAALRARVESLALEQALAETRKLNDSVLAPCFSALPVTVQLAFLSSLCDQAGRPSFPETVRAALHEPRLAEMAATEGPDGSTAAKGLRCAIESLRTLGLLTGTDAAQALLMLFSRLRLGMRSPELSAQLAEMLSAHAAGDHDWWKEFWGTLGGPSAPAIRGQLVASIAASDAVGALAFAAEAVRWSDDAPVETVFAAGMAFSKGTDARLQDPLRALSQSPDPRRVMLALYSVPSRLEWPSSRIPIFGDDQVRDAILSGASKRSPEDESVLQQTRASAAAKAWQYFGPEYAANELYSVIAPGIPNEAHAFLRVQAALRALSVVETFPSLHGPSVDLAERALREGFAASNEKTISDMVIWLQEQSASPPAWTDMQRRLRDLVGDRLPGLHQLARKALGQ